MLPDLKPKIDLEKDKAMRAIPPLNLSKNNDKIIEIHKTDKFIKKHAPMIGANKFGTANLSPLEEKETDDKIAIKNGQVFRLSKEKKQEDEAALVDNYDKQFASDEEAQEDL